MADKWHIKYKMPTFNAGFFEEAKVTQRAMIEDLAKFVYEELISYIEQGRNEWPPLSEVTKWLKGSDTLLVDSGDFKRAIQYEVSGDRALVGVLIPKGSHGQDMELIANVIEGGAVIPVTPRMRGWFAWKGRPLSRTTTAIVVPERPLFSPSLDALEENIEDIVVPYFDSLLERI